MFADLPQSIHSTANKVTNDGEAIIADVAKKIWGKNVPQTFLTALDIEIPIASEDEEDTETDPYSSVYLAYSSNNTSRPLSRGLSSKRRTVILPALEVTKETIPKELIHQNLGFPSKVDPEEIIPKIIETTQFQNGQQQSMFQHTVMSNRSLDIISDAFWWFLINEWKQTDDDDHSEVQQQVFSRMSKNYVNLFLRSPKKHKDVIFDNYYDLLSQSIFTCFIQQYPKSKDLFTNDIKLKILHMTSKWTIGLIPSSLSISHWDIAINSKSNKRRHQQSALDMDSKSKHQVVSECMIPTQVTRKDVVFKHSEFVQYYLKHEAKIEVGEKTTVRINMTYTKPGGDKLLFHKLNEEALERGEDTERARTKLINTQKELNKMVRADKNKLKEYENELLQQKFIATKNKKQFVKSILKNLLPSHVTDNAEDQIYV